MNCRESVLNLLDPSAKPHHMPAAFFIHFDEDFRQGKAAVDKHLEYNEYTNMDIIKVQYEDRFPLQPWIREPADWAKMPIYDLEFYQNQLDILADIIRAAGARVLVIQTMYSPFMQASTTTGRDLLKAHINKDPGTVQEGMARITESMLAYVKECIALGVDGFYASTQGGDVSMFDGSTLFEKCIKPYDLTLMGEMDRSCAFNILHICDFHSGYRDLTPFADYPGHVVSKPLRMGATGTDTWDDPAPFDRPLMGGLDRHGVIATGTDAEIVEEVNKVLATAPKRFFLGADCTLPDDVSWDNIRTAVESAHAWG